MAGKLHKTKIVAGFALIVEPSLYVYVHEYDFFFSFKSQLCLYVPHHTLYIHRFVIYNSWVGSIICVLKCLPCLRQKLSYTVARAPSTKSSVLRGTLLHRLYLAQAGMRHGKCAPEGIFLAKREKYVYIFTLVTLSVQCWLYWATIILW